MTINFIMVYEKQHLNNATAIILATLIMLNTRLGQIMHPMLIGNLGGVPDFSSAHILPCKNEKSVKSVKSRSFQSHR